MYLYWDWQTTSQRRKNQDKTYEPVIWGFNANRTKNREVTQYVPLEVEINRHKEQINTAVIDLNSTDVFIEYN